MEISCIVNVTVDASAVGNNTLVLQLNSTDHNIVCNQSLLSVTIETYEEGE